MVYPFSLSAVVS